MLVRSYTGGAFAENTWLAADDAGRAVAVDPGASVGALLRDVEQDGLDLRAVLLTHAHLDHVEGGARVRAAHPEVPFHLHPADRPLYDALPHQAEAFGIRLQPPPPPDRELEDGTSLRFGDLVFQVRHSPGHAPGHVILWAEEEGLAFVGDVIFRGSIGRTDLPGGDFRVLMESIRKRVLTLPDATRLLTGHGPETTVRDERRGNPFLIPHYGGELA